MSEQVVREVGRLGVGEQLLVAVLEIDDVLDARRQTLDHAVREQHPRLRVRERVVQLGLGVALVERHERHAGARHRLVQLDVAVAVRADDGDAVAAPSPSPRSAPTSRRHRSHVSAYVSSMSPHAMAVWSAAIWLARRSGPIIVVMRGRVPAA